jgi:hypothetical protein
VSHGKQILFLRLQYEKPITADARGTYKSYLTLDDALSDTEPKRGRKVFRVDLEFLGSAMHKLALVTESEPTHTMGCDERPLKRRPMKSEEEDDEDFDPIEGNL